MKKRKAFTLFELLVVVAIISVLISLLLPALGSARSQAKEVSCLSNLKQWNIVLTMYMQDNNDWLMPRQPYAGDWTISWEPQMVKAKYAPDDKKFNTCPAQDDRTIRSSLAYPYAQQGATWVTYAANFYMWAREEHLDPDSMVGGNLHKIRTEPVTSIMMCETSHPYSAVGYCGAYNHLQCSPLHRDSSNFLFLDGHAGWMKDTGSWVDPISMKLFTRYWRVGAAPY
jgi:prepilin-type N-terminal cleavage/methylation domain-containing protein/prepilin-type processing-associated H-X9-DG protein